MPAGGEILTILLNNFGSAFISGLKNIQNLTYGTLSILLSIDFILAILLNLENGDHLQTIIKKMLKYGLFFYFIENWGPIINYIIDGFSQAGATAGSGSKSIISDPSAILNVGFNLASPIPTYMNTIYQMGWTAVLVNFFNLAMFFLCWILIIIAFGLMGIQAFITYLEFYLVSTLSLIFIPWGVNKHTSFLAEKAFGSIVSFGVKFMVLTFILCVAKPLINTWTMTVDVNTTWDQMLFIVIGCWTVAFLCWQAPGLASGLMSGSPTLTAGTVAGSAAATGSAIAGGASAAKAAGGALAGAAGSAAKGAAGLAGAAAGGAAGKSGLQAAAGALGGMASHVGGGIKSAVQNSAPMQAASSIKDAFNGGAASASGGSGSSGGTSSSTSTGAGSGGSSGSTDTSGSSDAGSRGSPSSRSDSLASASSTGAGSSSGGSSDGFSADSKTGLLLPSSVANSRNYKPVDNSTPPQSSSASGGANGVVASPKASTSNANSSSTSANQQDKPGVISSIAQLVNQGHSMIPPEASPSGGIHVPIKSD
jgi:type IV secretion system protein TrbL